MTSFINAIVASRKTHERLGEKLGGMEIELFLQSATISNVADPEELSRVKVLYGENANAESDWMPLLNQGKGRISSQFLGTKAIVATISGNSDNPIVLGIFGDTPDGLGVNGPVTIPVIDKADLANATDPGSICSEKNEGRIYIFTNNVSQDAKICMRRNNRQNDPNADVWEWKNISRGLVVEKSDDPKQVDRDLVKAEKKPLPKCSQELESEQITFTEDRDFRQIQLVCNKDENGDWAWTPIAAVPKFIKTMLPKCTEKTHGMTSLIDDGNNSEMAICVRFDQDMKWVKYGSRQVIKFANKPEPPKKSQVLNKKVKPNPNLNVEPPVQNAAAAAVNPVIGNPRLVGSIFQQTAAAVVPGYTNDAIEQASKAVEALKTGNVSFDTAMQLGSRLLQEQGLDVNSLDAVLRNGDLATAQNFLEKMGPEVAKIAAAGSDLSGLLATAGSNSLIDGLGAISPEHAGAENAMIIDGPLGSLNFAVQNKLDAVPSYANEAFKFAIKDLDLNNAPAPIASVLGAGADGGLSDVVNSIAGGIDFNNVDVSGLASSLTSGNLGEVGKIFQDFGNIGALSSFAPGLPATASSLLGAVGLGGPLTAALPGGIGLTAATLLLGGNSPLTSIIGGGGLLGGIGGIGGLFGGGGGGCPCDPKCRKTSHGVDSDGNRLLDPCGNLTLDNSNVYGSDILNNNKGVLAQGLGLLTSGIGADLIPKNPFDFTSVLKSIPRIGDLSKKLEDAFKGGAEGFDKDLEMLYSFEAIEKTFKIADNNLSLMELIQNLELLGSQNFMNNLITGPAGGLLGKVTADEVTQAKAIADLYEMVKELDRKKDGGDLDRPGPTPAIASTLLQPVTIPAYFSKSRVLAIINLIKTILEALSILSSLDPQLGAPFENLETRNTESKVLNDSLSAKLSMSQPQEDTINYVYQDFSKLVNGTGADGLRTQINFLTPNQLDSGEFDTLLDQIKNEQERAARSEGSCD